MSRNNDFQFVKTDVSELETLMISAYEKLTGVTVYPASPERLFIEWVASIVLQERIINNYTGNQNIPSRAEGANLDALGELFYTQTRPAAKAAHAMERFYISEPQSTSILVPAGTRVTDISSNVVWNTIADAYVPIGSSYVDIPIQCQSVGAVGNGYAVGQINTIVDLYDYYSRCENITISDGGADEASDDEFYEIMRASMDAYSTAGPSGAYIYHAKSVSTEIADVAAVRLKTEQTHTLDVFLHGSTKYAFIGGESLDVESLKVFSHGGTQPAIIETDYDVEYEEDLLTITINPDGSLSSETQIDVSIDSVNGGHVTIYVLMADGLPAGEEIKGAVLDACSAETVRPLTDYVTMGDPDIVNYNIEFTYYIPSSLTRSSVEIESAVANAVEEYKRWQMAKLGRDINPSYLMWLLMQTGIKRVNLVQPVFTVLRDGSDNTVPQLANCQSVSITNGGTEDE